MAEEKVQRQQMWKTMLDLVMDSIENHQLHEILDVIRKNLIYEDPGLLSAVIDEHFDEIIQEESLNIWLLNQIVHNSSLFDDERITKKLIEFQKDFLSGSLIKKPALFKKILNNYVEFIRDLIELEEIFECSPLETFHFGETKFIKEFQENAIYHKIVVRNDSHRDKLLETYIQILMHIVPSSIEFYEKIFTNFTNHILDVLDKSHMNLKCLCFDYICQMLENNFEFGEEFLLIITKVCEKIIEIFPNAMELVDKNLLIELTVKINKVFQIISVKYSDLTKLKYPTDYGKKLIFYQLNILNLITSKKYANFLIFFQHLIEILLKIINVIIQCKQITFNNEELTKIIKLSKNCPQLLNITETTITNNLIISKLSSIEEKIINYCEIWKNVDEILQNALNSLICENDDYNKQNKNVIILIEIFNLIDNVNFNYQIFHQNKVIKESQTLNNSNHKNLLIFVENFHDFELKITDFLKSFKAKKKLKIVEFYNVIRFFGLLISNSMFAKFNDILQKQIITLIIEYIEQCINIANNFPFKELDPDKSLNEKSIEAISNVHLDDLKLTTRKYFIQSLKIIFHRIFVREDLHELQEIVYNRSLNFFMNKTISYETLDQDIIKPIFELSSKPTFWIKNLKNFICFFHSDVFILQTYKNNTTNFEIFCKNCDYQLKTEINVEIMLKIIKINKGILTNCNELKLNIPNCLKKNQLNIFFDYLCEENSQDFLLILNHCDFSNDNKILKNWSLLMPKIVELIILQNPQTSYEILSTFIEDLLNLVGAALEQINKNQQKIVINLISKFVYINGLSEQIVYYLFKLTIMFLIRFESEVSQEAARLAIDLCHKQGFIPKNFLVWYQRDLFKLIMSLSASMYLIHGFGLQKSLNCVSRMLGYKGPREFTYRNYDIIVTMLIEFCVYDEKCEDLLNEVVFFTKIDLKEILKKSFLSFYLEYFIDKKCSESNDCLDYITQKTECDIFVLINSDIKKTVAKMLIYYHKNPKAVMETFRCLILKETASTSSSNHQLASQSNDVIKFIADRFLGVITYFEIYLMSLDFEKCLKIEILRSLGEIIRFLGSKYITPFHFKILAMLTTVISLDDTNLKRICVDVWKIFIHNVDVEILGASLSRIVAALEPLVIQNPVEVNSIYKFLILSNGNLLSKYVPELYFIENLNICDEVKEIVAKQIEKKWKTHNLIEKICFFIKEITHENVIIRVNGLKYLKKLIAENRQSLNSMILGQNFVSPIIETILESLMIGCKHDDNNLKLASGKCISELGAIEPELLRPNYSQQNQDFSLDIHSDSFAIMALKELCKAYQFQKDTLYVDNFSLGIQEILVTRGVCPKKNTKMEVWKAIPERMRQIMEPLLTSCYTGMQRNQNSHVHPVFGSKCGNTVVEWAFNWSSNMVERIDDAESKHLLNSLLPSVRRDNNVLEIFLPYIILHALQNCNDEYRLKIFEELQFVFNSVIKKDLKSDCEDESKDYYEFELIQLDSQSQSTANLNRENDFKLENSTKYIGIKCAKMGFELFDFLEKWMYEFSNIYSGENQSTYLSIQNFCSKFDLMQLALSNFNCGEYARALKYCEAYIEKNSSQTTTLNNGNIQEHLSFLINIYVELLDSDSLEGAIYLKKSESSLREQIVVNSMTDRLQETAACYEQLIKDLENSNELHTMHANDWDGIIQCYLRLDTPETALLIAQGVMKKLGEQYIHDCLKESQVEPLWRLGRFDELDELLEHTEIDESSNWQIQCGQALLLFHKSNEIPIEKFEIKIDTIRHNVLSVMKFGGADCDSYHKGYLQITRLHMLSDIEKSRILIERIYNNLQNESECIQILTNFFNDWNARLEFLQPTIKITEPFLCIRRAILNETKNLLDKQVTQHDVIKNLKNIINDEIGKLWIRSVQHNRKSGCFQQAHLSILNAEKYKPNNLFIEKAKLFWQKGDQPNCFKIIEEKIDEIEKIISINSNLNDDIRLTYAEAKFLQASYNADSMNISSEINIKYFQESLKHNPKSEKTHVSLAQYYDRIYGVINNKNANKPKIGEEYLLRVMYNYGRSMFYGCEFMFQSMPRMLSIWFDINVKNSNASATITAKVQKINEFMDQCSQCLPLFLYFTAFSQLVSRICHPCENVWKILKTIIVRLVEKYSQHSLWMILPIFKSSLSSRVKRCIDIFSDKRLCNPELQKLIKDFNYLADRLIELTNMELPKVDKLITVSKLIPALPKLLNESDFSQIMIPFERFMQMTLPPLGERNIPSNQFNPFPNNLVYIHGIREQIEVLNSLQKPKKVTLIGSDGKDYTIMLKPKDDLRKDFRLMEFNAVVKQYLYQDAQARQRRLGIRTYAVLPLNEECGIIEWVDNLRPFRQIVLDIYKKMKLGMSNKELKKYMTKEDNPVKRRQIYLNEMLLKHPPVFNKWFLQNFTNPHNWYQARTSYIRTTSVMSIVGYILGLGDRHGENILFDASTGDIVHVDFNCLFNRGETFAFPEKVPFRLTHNMVHAMGPLGIEGPFKKCCEITIRVLQAQTPILMSVLKPFIYDPLVTWNKRYRSDKNIEITDDNAISNVNRIEARLQGYVNFEEKGANVPLSPEGVVNYVILKATNIDNLSSMYVGWGPFL